MNIEQITKDFVRDVKQYLEKSTFEPVLLESIFNSKCPFEYLGIDCISRSDFYRRKNKLLSGIADSLGFERRPTPESQ